MITNSQYNSIWSEKEEKNLYRLLDELDEKGAKFGISNIVNHKGKQNKILKSWMFKYKVLRLKVTILVDLITRLNVIAGRFI